MLNSASTAKPDVPPPLIKHVFEASDDEELAPRMDGIGRCRSRETDATRENGAEGKGRLLSSRRPLLSISRTSTPNGLP